MKRIAVIMAGGSGERFWPLSRMEKPKQLLPLLSDKIMLEEAIDRINGLIDRQDIYIITSELLVKAIRWAVPTVPAENVIAEPCKRNTAPCLALAAAVIKAKYDGQFADDEISIAVLTADQDIRPVREFRKTVASAMDFIEIDKSICTIGIPPTRPETGYGYLEMSSSWANLNMLGTPEKDQEINILPVKSFREKPDLDTAKVYMESGVHLWNSGMFFFRLDTFCEGMLKHLPEVGSKINDMADEYRDFVSDAYDVDSVNVGYIFEKFPNISIDYGLMEKFEQIYSVTAKFHWDDVGSWDSLERVKCPDQNGNITEGVISEIDCKNTIVVNKTAGKIAVGAIGLDNFVVVVTKDAVLICPKEKVQDVKKCVQELKNNSGNQFV